MSRRPLPAWRGPTIPYMPGIRYGKRPTGPGGKVTISSRVGDRIVRRHVTIAPAFDPNALSMTPLPGWTAAGLAARKAA